MAASGKSGTEFVKHEYDEAIAVQQGIVDAAATLAKRHPIESAREAIKGSHRQDRDWLKRLQRLGKQHGASGVREDVADGLVSLMEKTLRSATEAGTDSEYYEAHAVLLTLKRKQMDSAGGMRRIATATDDKELSEAAQEFGQDQRASSQSLARELAAMAKGLASQRQP
jgi:hypothetical protein